MSTINKSTPIPVITAEVLDATRKLEARGLPVLPEAVICSIIPKLFTDKADKRHPAGRSTRVRSQAQRINHPDREVSNAARTTANLLRWHTGGGNLHGLFAAQFDAPTLFDGIDTLAQTVLVLSGVDSTALKAWKGTGLFNAE